MQLHTETQQQADLNQFENYKIRTNVLQSTLSLCMQLHLSLSVQEAMGTKLRNQVNFVLKRLGKNNVLGLSAESSVPNHK